MWAKEKFCRIVLSKKIFLLLNFVLIYFLLTNNSSADLQKKIINKLTKTQTLSFEFTQVIADKKEVGNCFIKYPLLMKCNYQNLKGKTIISNGKTVAIIKRKYKKVYLYPIKSTPLFFILKKKSIIDLIEKIKPIETGSDLVEFVYIDKKKKIVKLLFNKSSLNLNGWKTKDAYSNNVSFKMNNIKVNNQIVDSFFIIPQEKDL